MDFVTEGTERLCRNRKRRISIHHGDTEVTEKKFFLGLADVTSFGTPCSPCLRGDKWFVGFMQSFHREIVHVCVRYRGIDLQRGCAATGGKKDFVTEGTERAARDTEGTEDRMTPRVLTHANLLFKEKDSFA